jgi:hypothetical protein
VGDQRRGASSTSSGAARHLSVQDKRAALQQQLHYLASTEPYSGGVKHPLPDVETHVPTNDPDSSAIILFGIGSSLNQAEAGDVYLSAVGYEGNPEVASFLLVRSAADVVHTWMDRFGRPPLGPTIQFSFVDSNQVERQAIGVFDDYRPDVPSRADHGEHYFQLHDLLHPGADDDLPTWVGGYMDERAMQRLARAALASAISLSPDRDDLFFRLFTDPDHMADGAPAPIVPLDLQQSSHTDKIARLFGVRRRWHRLTGRMLTHRWLIPVLIGILPHLWRSRLLSYSSTPWELSRLMAEHYALSRHFRSVLKETDESYQPVDEDRIRRTDVSVLSTSPSDVGDTTYGSSSMYLDTGAVHLTNGAVPEADRRIIRAAAVRFEHELSTATDMSVDCLGGSVHDLFKKNVRECLAGLGNRSASPTTPAGQKYRFRRNRGGGFERYQEEEVARLILGDCSDSCRNSVLDESGLSMDDSVDSQGNGRCEGIAFADYLSGVDALISRHGCAVRMFDPDDRSCDHWAVTSRLIDWNVAKCIHCQRHNKHEHIGWPNDPTSPVQCTRCRMPFHPACAAAADPSFSPDAPICGQCDWHLGFETAINNPLWTRYLTTGERVELHRPAPLSESQAWNQPKTVALGITVLTAAGQPIRGQFVVTSADGPAPAVPTVAQNVAMRIMQTEDTPTGQVSPIRVRALARAVITRELEIDPDADGVTLRMLRDDVDGLAVHFTNQDAHVVSVQFLLDVPPGLLIQAGHIDSVGAQLASASGAVTWSLVPCALPDPGLRLTGFDSAGLGLLKPACHRLDRQLHSLGVITAIDFFTMIELYSEQHRTAPAVLMVKCTGCSILIVKEACDRFPGQFKLRCGSCQHQLKQSRAATAATAPPAAAAAEAEETFSPMDDMSLSTSEDESPADDDDRYGHQDLYDDVQLMEAEATAEIKVAAHDGLVIWHSVRGTPPSEVHKYVFHDSDGVLRAGFVRGVEIRWESDEGPPHMLRDLHVKDHMSSPLYVQEMMPTKKQLWLVSPQRLVRVLRCPRAHRGYAWVPRVSQTR